MRKTIIVNPVGAACNLKCDYCYNSHLRKSNASVMTDNVVEQVIKTSLPISDDIVYLFHGGEPLLAGIPFFEKVLEYQGKYIGKHTIQNHIQTNATLINRKWARFLTENKFRISTSLDGPRFLHDTYRKDKYDKGTFSKVKRGIQLMNETGASVGIVVTVNNSNVFYPESVYDFLIHDVQANGFEINLCSPTKDGYKLIVNQEDVVNFLITVFDKWWKDDNPDIRIRLFENPLRVLLDDMPVDCTFKFNACRHFIAVDENGNLFPCARFIGAEEMFFGNIMNIGIDEVLKNKQTQIVYEKMSLIPKKCQECKWLKSCGAGCAYQRWLAGGFSAAFPQCEIRQKLFEHINKKAETYF